MCSFRVWRSLASSGYRGSLWRFFAVTILSSLSAAQGLDAQASSASVLAGSVVDGFDDPVVNAVVTLWMGGVDTGREVSTDRAGRFTLDALPPGRYHLRVEARGFHPRVVKGVTVRTAGRASITVRLRESQPPVTEVDTVQAIARGPEGQRWLEGLELDAPSPSREVSEALELVTTMDARLGALGLPSGYTTTTVQGVPYRSAAVAPGVQDAATALSVGSAGLIRIAPLGAGRGFGLGAGGDIEISNPMLPAGGLEVFGAYSWSSLWTGRYDIPEGFTPSSFWGGFRTSLDLVPDAARIVVGADVQHVERPRKALFPGGSAGGAGIEDAEVVSAFTLMDWDIGGGSRVDFGARLGARPSANSVHPLAYPDFQSGFKARDIILGGGFLSRIGRASGLSVRAGFTRSERSGSEAWPVDPGTPFLYDVTRGSQGGIAPLSRGEGSRQGVFGSVALRHELGAHSLEGGLELLRSTHELQPLAANVLWAAAGDPFADGWRGMATGYRSVPVTSPFSVLNLALFARDAWDAAPGLRVLVGVRFHRERLPVEDLRPDEEWAEITGLTTSLPEPDANGFAGHLGLDWLVGGTGAVRVTANVGATVDEIDPWILAEALALDGQADFRRSLSGPEGFDAWPAFPVDGGATRSRPTLTLLPASMDLPASAHASLGISTGWNAWWFGVSGVFRRTENLPRRADLNRATTPSGVTEAGLPVWGSLLQVGSLVTEIPGSSRQFQEFDHVWAVMQDGWSRYAGVSFFIERRPVQGIQLAAWYTYSATTDNLPGLGSGRPELATAGTVAGADDWSEGTSDLDVPHRVGVAAAVPFPVLAGGVLRGRFRLDSGRPFTPGLRGGVDLDADGIAGNEPVYIPAQGVDGLDARWSCVSDQRGGFVERNSCRLPDIPYLDLGISLGLFQVGGGVVSLQVDALNILQAFDTQTDRALFLVNPSAALQPDGTALSPVLRLNPGLGGELSDTRDGRMIRIGLRWGGGE